MKKQRLIEITHSLDIIKDKLKIPELSTAKVLKMKTYYNELVIEYNSLTILKKKIKFNIK